MKTAYTHPHVTVKPVQYHAKEVIGIFFPYHPDVIRLVKKIRDTSFSRTLCCWTTPYRETIEQEIHCVLDGHATLDFDLLRKYTQDKQRHKTCPSEYVELLARMRYSVSTIKNYVSQFESFINYYEKVIGQARTRYGLERPVKESKLPTVLS